MAGNFEYNNSGVLCRRTLVGTITLSNGHNVFGSDVAGNIPGDRENIAPGAIFAAVDPDTGGGKLGPDGTVALQEQRRQPGAQRRRPVAANVFDQRGAARPQPAGSLPDLGAVELNQPLSTGATANNDVRSGTNAANNLPASPATTTSRAWAATTRSTAAPAATCSTAVLATTSSQGGTGLDLVAYPGTAAVMVDLSGTNDTAKRGGETDTLIGIEGALGSSGNDRFKGDALNNEFQGKAGKDTMTGGGGRDTWDFNDVADSPAGATRDVVTDFVPGQDVLDLAGIDADGTSRQPELPLGRQGHAHRRRPARLFHQRRHDDRARQHRRRCDTEVEIQLTGVKTLTAGDFRP